jgi:carbonic anhydrase
VQRVTADLGVKPILALSPQAKGRIERLWRTLQDRLSKELRLARISSLSQANEFLPSFIEAYNARFARPPAQEQSAWMKFEETADIEHQFSTCEERKVRRAHHRLPRRDVADRPRER